MKTEVLYFQVPYLKVPESCNEGIKKILYFAEIGREVEYSPNNVVAVGVKGNNEWRSWGKPFDRAIAHLVLTGGIPDQYEDILKEKETDYLLPFLVRNDNHD